MAKGGSRPETVGTNAEAAHGKASDQPDKLIEELREAIRVRDDFLAIATHELRNPLTPILLGVQLIRAAEKSGRRKADAGARSPRATDQTLRCADQHAARSCANHFRQVSAGPFRSELVGIDSGIVND